MSSVLCTPHAVALRGQSVHRVAALVRRTGHCSLRPAGNPRACQPTVMRRHVTSHRIMPAHVALFATVHRVNRAYCPRTVARASRHMHPSWTLPGEHASCHPFSACLHAHPWHARACKFPGSHFRLCAVTPIHMYVCPVLTADACVSGDSGATAAADAAGTAAAAHAALCAAAVVCRAAGPASSSADPHAAAVVPSARITADCSPPHLHGRYDAGPLQQRLEPAAAAEHQPLAHRPVV